MQLINVCAELFCMEAWNRLLPNFQCTLFTILVIRQLLLAWLQHSCLILVHFHLFNE